MQLAGVMAALHCTENARIADHYNASGFSLRLGDPPFVLANASSMTPNTLQPRFSPCAASPSILAQFVFFIKNLYWSPTCVTLFLNHPQKAAMKTHPTLPPILSQSQSIDFCQLHSSVQSMSVSGRALPSRSRSMTCQLDLLAVWGGQPPQGRSHSFSSRTVSINTSNNTKLKRWHKYLITTLLPY